LNSTKYNLKQLLPGTFLYTPIRKKLVNLAQLKVNKVFETTYQVVIVL